MVSISVILISVHIVLAHIICMNVISVISVNIIGISVVYISVASFGVEKFGVAIFGVDKFGVGIINVNAQVTNKTIQVNILITSRVLTILLCVDLWIWLESMYSLQNNKCDTLVNCQLSTVNCQLSTVNCHLLTLPNNSQEMFPGSLHSVCQSISGKILFSGNFLNYTIFLARDLCQFHDIS